VSRLRSCLPPAKTPDSDTPGWKLLDAVSNPDPVNIARCSTDNSSTAQTPPENRLQYRCLPHPGDQHPDPTNTIRSRNDDQSDAPKILPVRRPDIHAAARGVHTGQRENLNYQNTPNGTKSCATCLEFTPGQSDQKTGSCKLIPGDDEISASGYCLAWNTM